MLDKYKDIILRISCDGIIRKCGLKRKERNCLDCIDQTNEDAIKAIEELSATAENLTAELEAIIRYMRKTWGHCAGCKHFTGIKGCGKGVMSRCGGDTDYYELNIRVEVKP